MVALEPKGDYSGLPDPWPALGPQLARALLADLSRQPAAPQPSPLPEAPEIPLPRVAEWRRAAGLSQSELGRKIGLSQGYVSLIERGLWGRSGDRDPATVIPRLALAFGVTVAGLLEGPKPR